jgi:MFS transporter, DHA1 family, multidrug resistance protein
MATVTAAAPYRGIWLTLLLSLLLGFASISTDLYLPALPTMSESLGASQGELELTISGYLLGFAVGQLVWGPLSDRYGRKGPLLLGIAIFAVGAAGCALSGDVWQMIGWRLVQALGASAAVVLGRAIVRDLFDGKEAARTLSTLMMIMGVAPMIGPILGAQILALFSWHAIFWTLVGIGLITMVAVGRLAESLPIALRAPGSLGSAFARYGQHFRNPVLLAHAGALGCFSACIFAYVAGSPFVFITFYGLAPDLYGLLFGSSIIGIMLATALNRRLLPRFGSSRLMLLGTSLGTLVAILLLAQTATQWGGVVALTILLFVFVTMNGFVAANAIAGGLSAVEHGIGSASALLGFAQYGGGMLGSAAVGAIANGTPVPMALTIALFAACAAGSALVLGRGSTSLSLAAGEGPGPIEP